MTEQLFERWDKAKNLPANPTVQAISDARNGGPVEVRYNRNGAEVMVLFTKSGNQELAWDIAEAVGVRAASLLTKSQMGGDLVVHIPAQIYVDKLGGEVPGFQRQLP